MCSELAQFYQDETSKNRFIRYQDVVKGTGPYQLLFFYFYNSRLFRRGPINDAFSGDVHPDFRLFFFCEVHGNVGYLSEKSLVAYLQSVITKLDIKCPSSYQSF